MKSLNFELLRARWPELASLGGFAEQYAGADPSSAAVKLRSFAEQLVSFIYHNHGLPKDTQPGLNELLDGDCFKQVVPKVVIAKLHALRIHGNHAAHGTGVSAQTVAYLLKEAFDLGRWLAMTYAGAAATDLPAYQELSANGRARFQRPASA